MYRSFDSLIQKFKEAEGKKDAIYNFRGHWIVFRIVLTRMIWPQSITIWG